jgi:undecaprenyl-diphosphatase
MRMEDVFRAIVLGIVQGLTEFLPISSSGHLVVVRDLFHWSETDSLTFDVALHVGTTVAVLAYFWREWLSMARSVLLWVTRQAEPSRIRHPYDEHVFALIVLGSIPVAIAGLALESWLEDNVRDPVVIGCTFIVFGLVLFAAERLSRPERTLEEARPIDAVIIGLAQACSLVPGVSRSGFTISAALFRGFTRQDAARYSFLLSTPAIAGAALLKFSEAANNGTLSDNLGPIVVGAVVSAIVGFLAIGLLLRLIQSFSFTPYVIYRILAGVFQIVYFSV